MAETRWMQHTLARPDHHLAWYSLGTGPTVVWLNGGPGDDHHYLRSVVEPLAGSMRCILYDQRGCGASWLETLDATTLDVSLFIQDLEALRIELGEERLLLAGHSWGAMLALLFSASYPSHVTRTALIGLGPLDAAMNLVAGANQRKGSTEEERHQRRELRAELARLSPSDDLTRQHELNLRAMKLWARSAFATEDGYRRSMAAYMENEGYKRTNRVVNRIVNDSYKRIDMWPLVEKVKAELLVLYGYQDFEPITQAYEIRARLPETRLCFLNECGHEPWTEQPESFYRAIAGFFAGDEVL